MIQEAIDTGQDLTLEELERSTATGRDMRHLVGEAEQLDCCGRVAAADDGDGRGLGQSLGHFTRSDCEVIEFEDTHRAVPDNGAGFLDGIGVELNRLLTDIDTHPALREGFGRNRLVVGIGRETIGNHVVDRQQELDALLFGLLHQRGSQIDLVGLEQRASDFMTLRLNKGVGHAATDNQRIDLGQEVLDDTDLVRDLGAAEDGDKRALGIGECLTHHLDLLLDQVTGDTGEIVCDTGCRSVGTVGRTERVVDEEVCHGSKFLRKGLLVLRLFLVEADVLQHHDLTVFERCGLRLRVVADDIGCQCDLAAEQFGQAINGRLHAELGFGAALGTTQVGDQDDLGTLIGQVRDGRQSTADALVIRDLTFLIQRDVEVNADDNPLTLDLDIFDSFFEQIRHVKLSCTSYNNRLTDKIGPPEPCQADTHIQLF